MDFNSIEAIEGRKSFMENYHFFYSDKHEKTRRKENSPILYCVLPGNLIREYNLCSEDKNAYPLIEDLIYLGQGNFFMAEERFK